MSDNGDVKAELRELVALVGELSQNHKAVLERHEENLGRAYKATVSHKEAIEQLRADMRRYAEIVEKILARLGIADDSIPSPPARPN